MSPRRKLPNSNRCEREGLIHASEDWIRNLETCAGMLLRAIETGMVDPIDVVRGLDGDRLANLERLALALEHLDDGPRSVPAAVVRGVLRDLRGEDDA